jgi:transcription elongation factor Elf1
MKRTSRNVKEVHEILGERLKCIYCAKFMKNKGLSKYHIDKWHSDIVIKCNFHEGCLTFFKTEQDKEKHINEVHKVEKIREKFDCIYCGQT